MPQDFTRRLPYVPTRISRLKESQGRVAVTGAVVSKEKENYTFVIDDGESQVLVITNDLPGFENLKEGAQVRVLGKIMGAGEDTEILSDFVQDFSKIDKSLYSKYVIQ